MARAKKQESAPEPQLPRNDIRSAPDEPIRPHDDSAAIAQISELLGGQQAGANEDAPTPQGDGEGVREGQDSQHGPEAHANHADETGASVDDHPEGGAEDAPGDGTDSDEPEPEPITVKSLAEKLGVEPSDLYDGLEIALGKDGEHITLGEWKDRVSDLRELDTQRETFSAERDEYQKGQLRDRQLLQEMLSLIPADVAQQAHALASERLQGWQDEQQTAILEAIPEWQDADQLHKDREAIVSLGQEYGFSAVEMTHTQDARTVRMLRDFVKALEREKAADAELKRQRNTPNKKAKPNRQTAKRRLAAVLAKAKQTGDQRDQIAGVSAILNSR